MPGWVEVSSPDMLELRNAAPLTGIRTHSCRSINLAGRLGDATLPSLGEATLPGLGEAKLLCPPPRNPTVELAHKLWV